MRSSERSRKRLRTPRGTNFSRISSESFWRRENKISERIGILFIPPDQITGETVLYLARRGYPQFDVQIFDKLPRKPDSLRHFDVLVVPAGMLPLSGGALVIAHGGIGTMEFAFLHGCADYLVEPWPPEELFIRSLRGLGGTGIDFGFSQVVFGPFRLEAGQRILTLSFPEYLILRCLSKNRGLPVSRDLLTQIIGHAGMQNSGSRVVDVHVSSLRKKLRVILRESGPLPGWNPIRAVRGRGYALVTGSS